MLGFSQNLAGTRELGRRIFDGLIFASGGYPFSSHFLTANLPVFPLALVLRALAIAESLSGALNLEESSALSICADANIARLKKIPPKHAVQ